MASSECRQGGKTATARALRPNPSRRPALARRADERFKKSEHETIFNEKQKVTEMKSKGKKKKRYIAHYVLL